MNKPKTRFALASHRELLRDPVSLTARFGAHCPAWIALTISRRVSQWREALCVRTVSDPSGRPCSEPYQFQTFDHPGIQKQRADKRNDKRN
ncbi:hypothetical protein AVEN_118125-1 [Araneus ventricosus]|uniref:Uncharacterized protein n=1 Tax=Araneus ventricosus TaxID=182803 RepID=A0A4Y2LFI5_ARAVE|nr:hypothetical protein AVEN_118125-1 [Araneus ventricosus]